MRGRYAQQKQATKFLPYWQYIQIQRPTMRHNHSQYHLKVYRADDSIWDMIYPPRGFNCGCTVRALSDTMLKRFGLNVEDGSGIEVIQDAGWNLKPDEVWDSPIFEKYNDMISSALKDILKKKEIISETAIRDKARREALARKAEAKKSEVSTKEADRLAKIKSINIIR